MSCHILSVMSGTDSIPYRHAYARFTLACHVLPCTTTICPIYYDMSYLATPSYYTRDGVSDMSDIYFLSHNSVRRPSRYPIPPDAMPRRTSHYVALHNPTSHTKSYYAHTSHLIILIHTHCRTKPYHNRTYPSAPRAGPRYIHLCTPLSVYVHLQKCDVGHTPRCHPLYTDMSVLAPFSPVYT